MIVLVLGMHRSGTSLVVAMLRDMGVDLGQRFLPADEHNPSGYFEDLDFLRLNERWFRQASATWDAPPSWAEIEPFTKRDSRKIARLVRRKTKRSEKWGWKDPRTCITLPAYVSHLRDAEGSKDGDVRAVIMHRSEQAIAESLIKRDGGSYGKWLALLRKYEDSAEHWVRLHNITHAHFSYERFMQEDTRMQETTRLMSFVRATVVQRNDALKRIDDPII